MLTPDKFERQGAFIHRAMNDDQTVEEYPDAADRYDAALKEFREFTHGRKRSHFGREMRGAEILTTGEWNGIEFTEDDLDTIVSSFNAMGLKGRVPLKFGHNDEQPMTDGQPALGWVQRIYRNGKALLADFSDMPQVVHDAIREGLYKFVSVELLRDVKADNRLIRWVLDAVALLGADQPAVGNLKDLQMLTLTRIARLEHGERVTLRRDDSSEDSHMALTAEEKKEFDELRKNALKLERDNEQLKEKLDKQAADQAKAAIEAARTRVKDRLERAVQAKKILPKSRDRFERLYRVDKDEFVTLIVDKDIDDFVAECAEADKVELAKLKKDEQQAASKQSGGGKNSATEETGTNEDVFMSRVEKETVAMGFKANDAAGIDAATKVVMRRDRKLARAYLDDPRGEFSVEDKSDKEDKAA